MGSRGMMVNKVSNAFNKSKSMLEADYKQLLLCRSVEGQKSYPHRGDQRWLLLRTVHLLSRVRLFATPWTAARQASLPITNSQSLLTHVHWVGDAIQPSHPLLSPSPPAPNPSQKLQISEQVKGRWRNRKNVLSEGKEQENWGKVLQEEETESTHLQNEEKTRIKQSLIVTFWPSHFNT